MTTETSLLLELDAEMQKVNKLRKSRDAKNKKLIAAKRNLIDLMRDIYAWTECDLSSRRLMAKALIEIHDICAAEIEAQGERIR